MAEKQNFQQQPTLFDEQIRNALDRQATAYHAHDDKKLQEVNDELARLTAANGVVRNAFDAAEEHQDLRALLGEQSRVSAMPESPARNERIAYLNAVIVEAVKRRGEPHL